MRQLISSSFKKRKGFRFIVIDGEQFQFNWADNPDGPCLILYSANEKKIQIPYSLWSKTPHSQKFLDSPSHKVHHTWHGKHKKEACFGGWGKAEAAEMYRKYLAAKENGA